MVKRIVSFKGPEAAHFYRLIYSSFAVYRPSTGKEDIAESALDKLQAIGVEQEPAEGQNPDLAIYVLQPGEHTIELLESERDLILDALAGIQWPTFALARKKRLVSLLRNAEAREV